jgi:hypothetical protein
MSVHKKLIEARVKLLNTPLKKSGLNKFAGFQYFELGDFLPAITTIFNEVGLCGIVSFTAEYASLNITDVEDGSFVVITSPSVEVQMKGCLPIQGLGAAQTYLRRYLWVTAMEIVEHDALDATIGMEGKGKGIHKPTQNENYQPDDEEIVYLSSIVDQVLSNKENYGSSADYLEGQKLDAEEKVWVWDKLDSKTRSGIKKYNAENKESK